MMLKFSICSGVWTLAILLIVVSVARTRNHIPSTDYSLCYYHHNHCYRHYRGQLQTANYYSSSFTHLLGDFVNKSLNNTCLHDTLSFVELSESNSNLQDTINEDHLQRSPKNGINGSSAYKKDTSIPNSFFNRINDSIGDSYSLQTRSTVTANVTSSFRRKSDGRLWKRRTLCSVFDDEKYSAETAFQKDVFSDVDEKESAGEKKTLSDYDGSIFMSNVDDSDSLKAHVRVKRSESESNPRSSVAYQQDYLKDLANSFPHNSYESIDENSYDDDTSFDAKREIKSQEYFANDEQSVGPVPGKVGFENAPIPPSSNSDESLANIPLDDNKGNKLVEKNVDLSQGENQETMLEEPSKKLISFAEQQLQNMDSDMSSLPRDPMLAVELVRKKRDDYGKARSKEISDEKASLFGSLDDGQIIPLPLSSQDNQKNVLDSNDKKIGSCKEGNRLVYSEKHKRALNGHRKPFSMAIAGLKADLLRFKRRAKNGKTSKSKKKRKHVEKKHDSSRTRKMVRKKNAIESRVARERKNSETSGEGKSKVGIARVVSKKNNQNNFRRRSVKAKKSIEATDSANDRSSVRVRAKKIDENVVDDGSALSLAVLSGSDASDAKADEKGDSLARNENQLAFESERSMKEGTKLRTKRDKHAETNHGFADEEDELRYYENIREPEPEKAQCPNRDENPRSSEGNEAEGGRAARSIEEMKELVKKLVTKVGVIDFN